jgi:FkbM family methyltransferase
MGVAIDGVAELAELEALVAFLRVNAVDTFSGRALDVGANIGNHSLFLAQYFSKVYAIEPNPRVFQVLTLNAELSDNITPLNLAISNKSGVINLHIPPNHLGGARVSSGEDESGVEVQCVTVDSLLGDIDNVTLLKIDVEGHELEVAQGAETLLHQQQPLVVFEQHAPDFAHGTSPMIEYLKSCNYSNFYAPTTSPNVEGPRAWQRVASRIAQIAAGETIKMEEVGFFSPRWYPFILAMPAKGMPGAVL